MLLKRTLQLGFPLTIAELHLDKVVLIEATHIAYPNTLGFLVFAVVADYFLTEVLFALEGCLDVVLGRANNHFLTFTLR